MSFVISGVTVSVSFSDKEYGKGHEFFQNVSAKAAPDMNNEGYLLERADEVVLESITLFFTAWQGVLTQRLVAGHIKGDEYKTLLGACAARLDNVKRFLNKLRLEKSLMKEIDETDKSNS